MKSILSTLQAVVFFMLLFSCNKKQPSYLNDYAEAYQEYISAYSAGYHKRNQPVKVEFAKAVIESSLIKQEVDPQIYTIKPALKGKCIWKSIYHFEFLPDKNDLKANQEYEMSLDLKRLYPDIQKDLSTPVFKFKYQALEMSVDLKFPRPSLDDKASMYLLGTLQMNDQIEISKLMESIQVVSGNGKKLIPEIQSSALNPLHYDIQINGIPRLIEPTEIKLSWKTSFEDKDQKTQQKSFRIPGLNEFVVMGTDNSEIASRNMSIYFSNRLDMIQNIRGLIYFKNDSTELKLEKDGDVVHVHFSETWQNKSGVLYVSNIIKSIEGLNMAYNYEYEFQLIQNPPQVRFTHHGKILPYAKEIVIPFEAINLHTVEVEVFKTFTNNVLYNMHLGYDEYYDTYNMVRLGRVVKQKIIQLDELSPGSNIKSWKRYGLQLNDLIQAEPGANYQLRISFKPEYSEYPCVGGKPLIPHNFYDEESGNPKIKSFWRSYPFYDYNNSANYDNTDPCKIEYYSSDHFAKTSFFASNIAMIVKSSQNNGQSMVAVFDVLDGSPVKGAQVNFYDQQLQLMANKVTDGNGLILFNLDGILSYVQARSGDHYSYLKVKDNKSLSQSEFDISGVKIQEGLKASIYTERGVWRPGDTIFLNTIIHQITQKLPAQFPIELSLINPQRQVIYKTNKSDHLLGLFAFEIPTKESDITGIYTARVQVGLSVFEKNILIETVKPNRFKVEWPEIKEYSNAELKKPLPMKAMWLHGSPANGAFAKVSFKYKLVVPEFKKFSEYVFVDPELQRNQGEFEIYNNNLDANGGALISLPDFKDFIKTGKLQTTLISKISARDGDISTDYYESVLSPFNEFVGIKLPESPYGRRLEKGIDQNVQIIVLDKDGNPVANREVKIEVFQVSYEWWYELRSSFRGDYQRNSLSKEILNKTVKTDQNGKASLVVNIKEWDRYCIKATNTKNNYITGDYFYTGWNYTQQSTEFVNILSFKTDKESYLVGEEAIIELPGAAKAKYLISVIRGDKVIKNWIQDAKSDKTSFEVLLTKEMCPTVYLDISFIQAKEGKSNDLPLRLYGVIPIKVDDPNRKLNPKINMKNQIRPDEKFVVEVSEENGKEMAYQIFIVDEGLLNLTRFKTPNPYNDILSKEALTMLTWDNFNDLIGNMEGEMEKIFSIGGDLAVKGTQESKNKRFKPVVRRAGPLLLKKAEKKSHEFIISNYIGALRVMVIANDYNAFGSADKTVELKNELMTQLTVPRVFSYNDELFIPITIFSTDPSIKEVNVTLDVKGKLKRMEDGFKKIRFNQMGDQTIFYKVKGIGEIGNAEISVSATSGSFVSKNVVKLYVDNPNSLSHEVKDFWLEPGKTIQESILAYGMEGTRKVKIEVSGFSGLSIERLLNDLVNYPHGCLEQTISAVFPQIYLTSLIQLSSDKKAEVASNIQLAFDKLRRFQKTDGSLRYWAGMDLYSDWSNTYAGHFLIEAKSAGFRVPDDLLQKWYQYQKNASRAFAPEKDSKEEMSYMLQAYRLYILSLYGRPDWTAMNQLHQINNKDYMSRVLLSGAYALGGKMDIALNLFSGNVQDLSYYRESAFSFGSNTRDEALISQILVLLDKKVEAGNLLNKLIRRTSKDYSYSTQEMAMILIAIGKLYGNSTDHKMKFNYSWNDTKVNTESSLPIYSESLNPSTKQLFEFKNMGSTPMAVSIIQYGKETAVENIDISKGLKMSVNIAKNIPGNNIIYSGDELTARINIKNSGTAGRLDNIALTAIFPSGLEIDNRRIGGIFEKNPAIDYQDFRDDRLINYFSLKAGENISINIPLTAAYPGKYNSPTIFCEAMYDPGIYAKYRVGSMVIEVRK